MKKEIIVHYTFLLAFFLLISLVKSVVAPSFAQGWFQLEYLPFWLGGILGGALVYADHFIYAYFLKPKEHESVVARQMVTQNRVTDATNFLINTHRNNDKLVFHNAQFQTIFLALTFFVVTSSGSLLGRGLVLAFSLHLLLDMAIDYMEKKDITRWFAQFPVKLDVRQQRLYLVGHAALLIVMGFFF